jgi:hypothetical protein
MLVCLAGLFVGSLAGAAAVLASGTSTSAGDQQYVDPLTGSNTTTHPSSSSNTGSTGSGSTGSGSTGSGSSSSSSPSTTNGTLSSSPATSSGTSSSSTSDPGTSAGGHSGTLPFTGMNVWACVAIGAALLGTGLVLRRIVRLN